MLLSWISLWACLGNTGKQTEETAAPIVYPDACDPVVHFPLGALGGPVTEADPHQPQLGAAPTPYQVLYGKGRTPYFLLELPALGLTVSTLQMAL